VTVAQTSNSAATPYVTAPQFFEFYAPQLAADVLRASPDAPRPSYLAMCDSTNPAGKKLLAFLSRGAGEIEAAVAVSARYSAADLQALTGVSLALLQGLNSARAMWCLYQRLKPGSARPDDCPGAKESSEMLELLRNGERIFSFVESEQAGLPTIFQAAPQNLLTGYLVGRTSRLFPSYGPMPGSNPNFAG